MMSKIANTSILNRIPHRISHQNKFCVNFFDYFSVTIEKSLFIKLYSFSFSIKLNIVNL